KLEFGSGYLEDEAIFFPLLFSCKTITVVDEIFFLRRNRENSTMTMKPTARHVDGSLNCVNITLKLHGRGGFSKREKWHIKQRLKRQCSSYINIVRIGGGAF